MNAGNIYSCKDNFLSLQIKIKLKKLSVIVVFCQFRVKIRNQHVCFSRKKYFYFKFQKIISQTLKNLHLCGLGGRVIYPLYPRRHRFLNDPAQLGGRSLILIDHPCCLCSGRWGSHFGVQSKMSRFPHCQKNNVYQI